jgi:ribulose-phosphate 3-epimerase
MSVEPGFGGQKFMPDSLRKLRILKEEINRQGLNVLLEIDGGINAETAPLAVSAGADVLVAGNYIFSADDMAARVAQISSL